ncbi:MAG: multifunctional CCA addition/repair protein [Bacillota bacterium]
MKTYLVGGAVRDQLLGLPVKEKDWVVVGATPQELLDQGYKSVGKDFPVFLHPQTQEEYALARTERKTGKGYHGFEFFAAPGVTLEEDLRRRDLTVNALAQGPDGRLIDPYGGEKDLRARILRHVSPAFAEDPVRVLRAARFAARFAPLGFKMAGETLALMGGMVESGEVDHLVPERVWQETLKALGSERPSVYFEVLKECGALAKVFPELNRLWGVPQPAKWHPEIDTGVHVMMVLDQAARLTPDLSVRFAALTHDLGKGTTPKDILPHHYGHEERSRKLAEALCERLKAPREFRELAGIVAEFHGLVHKAEEIRADTLLKLLERVDAFRRPERFELFLLACEADHRGRTGLESTPFPQANYIRRAFTAARAVTTESLDTTKLKGAEIGEALRKKRLDAVHTATGRN